ncbi:hypothetical protein MMPV_003885 [Pyropia vietnamensis]
MPSPSVTDVGAAPMPGMSVATGAAATTRTAPGTGATTLTGAAIGTATVPAATRPAVATQPAAVAASKAGSPPGPIPAVTPAVTFIIPLHNGAAHITATLASVAVQDPPPPATATAIALHDDASTDGGVGLAVALDALPPLLSAGMSVTLSRSSVRGGVGGARNAAVTATPAGSVLVFLDADDVAAPDRAARSVAAVRHADAAVNAAAATAAAGGGDGARGCPGVLVGGTFTRLPADATPRYTAYHARRWAAATAFRDAPLAMPTLACSRSTWVAAGGFPVGVGVPEDLGFQYAHGARGGGYVKLGGSALVAYRRVVGGASDGLSRRVLLGVRVAAFERLVLRTSGGNTGRAAALGGAAVFPPLDLPGEADATGGCLTPPARDWSSFMIWSAGRDGRQLYGALSPTARASVTAFVDIDPRKVGRSVGGSGGRGAHPGVPVVGLHDLTPPWVCAVALDRGRGYEAAVAAAVARTGAVAGVDFFYLV